MTMMRVSFDRTSVIKVFHKQRGSGMIQKSSKGVGLRRVNMIFNKAIKVVLSCSLLGVRVNHKLQETLRLSPGEGQERGRQ